MIHQIPINVKKNGGDVIMLCCKCDEDSESAVAFKNISIDGVIK